MTTNNTIHELLAQLRAQGRINRFDGPLVANMVERYHDEGRIHSAGPCHSQWGDDLDSIWIVPVGGSREIIKDLKGYEPDLCRTQRLHRKAAKESGSSTRIVAWWD